jgi:hypothetical protein
MLGSLGSLHPLVPLYKISHENAKDMKGSIITKPFTFVESSVS